MSEEDNCDKQRHSPCSERGNNKESVCASMHVFKHVGILTNHLMLYSCNDTQLCAVSVNGSTHADSLTHYCLT